LATKRSAIKAQSRLNQGSIKAQLRLNQGSIKAPLSAKALQVFDVAQRGAFGKKEIRAVLKAIADTEVSLRPHTLVP
jgi:hypothetical protein